LKVEDATDEAESECVGAKVIMLEDADSRRDMRITRRGGWYLFFPACSTFDNAIIAEALTLLHAVTPSHANPRPSPCPSALPWRDEFSTLERTLSFVTISAVPWKTLHNHVVHSLCPHNGT
jgi:hypothetical protein